MLFYQDLQEGMQYLRTGVLMTGPKPFLMSQSMPSEGSGVRMSLNMMTPSGWNALQGCKESSVATSAFSERSLKAILSEYLDNTCCQSMPGMGARDGMRRETEDSGSLPESCHVSACLSHQPDRCPLCICRATRHTVVSPLSHSRAAFS